MKFVYFDASAGLSGDMISAALLDLGVPPAAYRAAVGGLRLPVQVKVGTVERAHLRARKIDVRILGKGSPARRWKDVSGLVKKADFPAAVKERGLAVFEALFKAEAKVHGEAIDRVHLHEAGADDALVDVLGTCWLAESLGVGEFYCSPLNVGGGSVRTAHGVLPVPAPAAAELLRGIPVYSAHVQTELVTPTGAALVKTLVSKFLPFPEITYDRIGCGAGGRDLETLPNILRAFSGERQSFSPDKRVYLLEAAIDDASPQVLAAFMDRALEAGALDVNFTPVVMKKNRLGTKLTLLAEPKPPRSVCGISPWSGGRLSAGLRPSGWTAGTYGSKSPFSTAGRSTSSRNTKTASPWPGRKSCPSRMSCGGRPRPRASLEG